MVYVYATLLLLLVLCLGHQVPGNGGKVYVDAFGVPACVVGIAINKHQSSFYSYNREQQFIYEIDI